MNKIVYDLLLKLEQCDDRHNRCDYLMEHDEITYLLEHIEGKDKKIERLNNIIKGIDDIIKNHYIVGHTVQNASIDSILKEIKELKEVIKNE